MGPQFVNAKLVNITIITIVYDTQITRSTWAYKPTYNWGGHPVISMSCGIFMGWESVKS